MKIVKPLVFQILYYIMFINKIYNKLTNIHINCSRNGFVHTFPIDNDNIDFDISHKIETTVKEDTIILEYYKCIDTRCTLCGKEEYDEYLLGFKEIDK